MNKVILIFLVFSMVGCAGTIALQREQTARIEATTSPAQLALILGKATVLKEFEISDNGKSYYVKYFKLQTGSSTEPYTICTPTCMVLFTEVPITTDYAVIQQLPEKSVFAWGTLEELSKDPDPVVSSLMPMAKKKIFEKGK